VDPGYLVKERRALDDLYSDSAAYHLHMTARESVFVLLRKFYTLVLTRVLQHSMKELYSYVLYLVDFFGNAGISEMGTKSI
jgi:hypothetical protein